MPADNFNDFGIQNFSQSHPAVAAAVARETAKQNGSNIDTPESMAAALYSSPGSAKISSLMNDPTDEAMDALLNFKAPDVAGKSAQSATDLLFGSAAQNLQNVRNAKIPISVKMMEVQGELDKLGQFNKAAHTKKRLRELDPVSDLDADIADMRQQMFVAQSFLDADPRLATASPQERQMLRANRMAVFTDAIGQLSRMRKDRLTAATGMIDDEISSHDDMINASSARISSLTRQLGFIKETGQDNEAMISLRSDLMKEQERLRKIRAGAGGKAGTAYSTQKEMMKIDLEAKFRVENKRGPTTVEKQALHGTVDNYLMRTTGGVSITGKKGDENMSIDPYSLALPKIDGSKPNDTFDQFIKDALADKLDGPTL